MSEFDNYERDEEDIYDAEYREVSDSEEASDNNDGIENNEAAGMTDEEIRAAAENIGSPYREYTNYSENSEEQRNENPYSAYTNYDYSSNRSYNWDTDTAPRTVEVEKKKGVFGKIAKFVGLAACFGAIAGVTFFGVTSGINAALGEDSFISATATTNDSDSNTLSQLGISRLAIANTSTVKETSSDSNVVVNVVKNNMSCSVCVNAVYVTSYSYWGQSYSQESQGGGSGFIVGMNDTELLIATNNHVVESTKSISVLFCNDKEVAATVRATDSSNDLAIVSVKLADLDAETLSAITIATLGDSDTAEVGEMVIAIGNALGYGQSVTVGYLSAKNREVTYEGNKLTLLQTDAAINQGNSGGPLFNTAGQVIGINCAKYSDTSVEGMCFAIPITAAMPILEDLMNREIVSEDEKGYLGVTVKNITSSYADLYDWPEGIYIYSVVKDGSAEAAGIHKGDIITAVNGTTVKTSDELISKVTSYKYGTTIQVTLQRLENGEWCEMTIDVVLMKKPTT